MNKKVFFILIGIVAFIAVLIFAFFEIKNVPDINWKEKYKLQSKEPHGLWLFDAILKNVYGKENVIIDYTFDTDKYNPDSTIYLAIDEKLEYDYYESMKIESFIKKGGEVILIGESIIFSGNFLSVLEDSIRWITDTTKYELVDIDTTFQYIYHHNSLIDTSNLYYSSFDITYKQDSVDTDLVNQLLIKIDTVAVFSSMAIDDGHLHLHNIPQLFTNLSSKQSYYDLHLDYVLSHLNHRKIVISKPKSIPLTDKSPLNVLLANKYFSAAYYTFLLAVLIFLVFNLKRKMKSIPIKEPVNNTSLEYVATLSRLYELQDQPVQLVKRMEENFYNYVYKNIFVRKNEQNFSQLVAKKSRVDINLIDSIIQSFDKIKKENYCEDYDMQKLYYQIEKFKKQSNDRR